MDRSVAESARTSTLAKPTLSVILPNFNHARYLPGALDALLLQELPAEEIIVVDDGSEDNSRDIIACYVKKNSSVRLLANAENMGVIPALIRGFKAARGDYVYFGAADDFVLPGFFAAALEMLQAYPGAGLYCGDYILIDGHSERVLGVRPPVQPSFGAKFINPTLTATLLRRNDNFIGTGAAILRRDAVVWAGGFNERLSTFADGYLVRKVALTFGFCYEPRSVQTWRIFSNSVSRKTATEIERTNNVLTAAIAQMTADPVFPLWYPEKLSRRWRLTAARLAIQESPINWDFLKELKVQGRLTRVFFQFVAKVFGVRAARFLNLSWLWFRLRPFTLFGLGSTIIARNWRKIIPKSQSPRKAKN